MISSELVDRIKNYKFFRKNSQLFNIGEIYPAANFAQLDLCSNLFILQSIARLKLVASQERYQFPAPVAITAITNVANFQVTAASHGLNTGDSCFIGSVVGATGANGKWTTVTKIDANNFTVDNSAAPGVWTSGGTVCHALYANVSTGSIAKLDSPFGPITKEDKAMIDLRKQSYLDTGASTNPPPSNQTITADMVVKYYEVYDDPIILGFWYTPGGSINTEVTFWRKPYPAEKISGTVNPIIPSSYDELFFHSTLWRVLNNLPDKEAEAESANVMKLMAGFEQRTDKWITKQRRQKREVAPRMRIA